MAIKVVLDIIKLGDYFKKLMSKMGVNACINYKLREQRVKENNKYTAFAQSSFLSFSPLTFLQKIKLRVQSVKENNKYTAFAQHTFLYFPLCSLSQITFSNLLPKTSPYYQHNPYFCSK
jgi:hypothetical protein